MMLRTRSSELGRWLIPLCLSLAGCGGCGEDLSVEGEYPYVRCLAMEAEDRAHQEGELGMRIEEGVLSIDGADSLVAFSLAPGNHQEQAEAMPAGVHLVFGGFGASRNEEGEPEEATLATLRALEGIVLLLPGGSDNTEAIDELFDALDEPRFVDLRGIAEVHVGDFDAVVVSGSPGGRYSIGHRSCGYGRADLAALPWPEGAAVLSWAAPRGEGAAVDLGIGGVNAGDPWLAETMGSRAGLFAWPREAAGLAQGAAGPIASEVDDSALRLVVPMLGAATFRFDESPLPAGGARVRWSEAGLQWSLISVAGE